MKQSIKDKSESYAGYLEDQREGSKGRIIGMVKQSNVDYWAEIEQKCIKDKRTYAIDFKVLPKAEGEKRYKAQFEKPKAKKVEVKKD